MQWYDLPREEKINYRLDPVNIGNNIIANNLDYGIHLYSNAISKEKCDFIISTLESEVEKDNTLRWQGAKVNDVEDKLTARNCFDIKYKRENLGKYQKYNQNLFDIHEIVENQLDLCLQHYESLWHLKMNYKEAFNFVKYSKDEYFKTHVDHGPYYTCTVSAVVYLNDDYDGGELDFIRHNLSIKPKAGDIAIFPSNFVYEHESKSITEGVKYSVVIMLDYNDNNHKENHATNY